MTQLPLPLDCTISLKPPLASRSKTCAICGKVFPYRKGCGSWKYCGPDCHEKGIRARQLRQREKAKRQKHRLKRTRQCVQCGAQFVVVTKRARPIYCSERCRAKAKDDGTYKTRLSTKPRPCLCCGKIETLKRGRKYCSQCAEPMRLRTMAMLKRHNAIRKELNEIRKRCKARIKQRKERKERAACVRAFRRLDSNAAVARELGLSDTRTHAHLRGYAYYQKKQQDRKASSRWRKGSLRAGKVSALFRAESDLSEHIHKQVKAHGHPIEDEVSVPGLTGRRIDALITIGNTLFGCEYKVTNHTAIADQCFGQAILKSIAFDAVPVCVFASDLMVDPTLSTVCKQMDVILCNELDIVEKLERHAKDVQVVAS